MMEHYVRTLRFLPQPPKKRQRPSPKAKQSSRPPPPPTRTTTAWDRLDVDRQNEIAAVADRIIIMIISCASDAAADAEQQQESSSSLGWKELAVRELRLGVVWDDDVKPPLPATLTNKDNLCEWLAVMVWQTQQARQVFALMDTHDKGCIVAQDLLTADLDGALDEEMVVEMMEEFVPDGEVLTENDIIRIARLVNLS
jgi:hypothetical protein